MAMNTGKLAINQECAIAMLLMKKTVIKLFIPRDNAMMFLVYSSVLKSYKRCSYGKCPIFHQAIASM